MKLKIFRLLAFWLSLLLLITALTACETEKKWDPRKNPKLHIERYEALACFYGMDRSAVLKQLGYTLDELVTGDDFNAFNICIPEQVEYAGVTFNIYLRFNNDAVFTGFVFQKIYSYPSGTEQAVSDILTIGEQLEKDLGKPDETDRWNDWIEQQYDTEMDPNPPSYQSEAEIRKLIENNCGSSIAWWDITGYACEAMSDYMKQQVEPYNIPCIDLCFEPNVDRHAEMKTIIISIWF